MIDISSHQVLEKAYENFKKSLKKQYNFSEFSKVWRGIGPVIDQELSAKRGVDVPKLGKFTFNAAGKPIFIVSNIFARNSRAVQAKSSLAGSRPNGKLNLSKVARETTQPKNIVEEVMKCIIETFTITVNKGRGKSVRLSFNPVGEVTCNDMKIGSTYFNDFLARQGAARLNPRNLARLGTQPALSTFAEKVQQDAAQIQSTRASSRRSAQSPVPSHASSRRISARGGGSIRSSRRSGYDGGSVRGSQRSRRSNHGNDKYSLKSGSRRQAVQSIGTPKRGQSAAADAHGESIIEKVKAAIIKRGGSHGIHAMGRVLKIMDDNGNKVLSREELKYGLRDYGIDLSNKQLDAVMTYFDRNHDGTVDIDEFLLGMAPPMNQRRLDLVKAAFDLMDYNQDGTITIEDMKLNVDPTGHDEVKRGKMKPDEWLTKYLNEFETDVKDGIVTWDEWKQYYQNLSASIDNTDFFELMMRNAWHMSGGKGQTANTTNRRVVVTGKDGKQTIQEVKNDLFIGKDDEKAMEQNLRDQGLEFDKMELYAKLDDEKNQFGAQKGKDQFKNRPAARKSSSNNTRQQVKIASNKTGSTKVEAPTDWDILRKILFTPPANLPIFMQKLGMNMSVSDDKMFPSTFALKIKSIKGANLNKRACDRIAQTATLGANQVDVSDLHDEMVRRFGSRGSKGASSTGGVAPVGSSSNIVDKIRKKIIARAGSHGLHALSRVLKIMDDDGNKSLSKEEFKNGMKDYGVELTLTEVDSCMTVFDRDRNGSISFDELVLSLAPPMDARRMKFVKMAFKLLDRNGDGTCTIDDLKYNYDADHHPSVKTGKVKSDEYLTEFLSQFDTIDKDGVVTFEEFVQYYQNLSASIDGDDYWELMMRNAWHISGGTGQTANTTNRRVVVTGKDGKQTIQEVKNDLFIGKDDEKAMEQNLRDQGLEFDKMELYAKLDDEKNQFGAQKGKDQFKKRPAARKSSSNNTRPANKAVGRKSARNNGSRRSDNSRNNNRSKINFSRGENKERDDPLKAYRKGRSKKPSKKDGLMYRRMLRLRAVMKLQSLFRKHKAKKVLAYKKRCKVTREKMQEEEEIMRAKEQARVKRPSGNNRGGFYSK